MGSLVALFCPEVGYLVALFCPEVGSLVALFCFEVGSLVFLGPLPIFDSGHSYRRAITQMGFESDEVDKG